MRHPLRRWWEQNKWFFVDNCFHFVITRPLDDGVINTKRCVNGSSLISCATRRSTRFSPLAGYGMFSRGSVSEFPLMGLPVCFTFPLGMATQWEVQGTTCHSPGSISRVKWSINDVTSSLSPAKFGVIPNGFEYSSRQDRSLIGRVCFSEMTASLQSKVSKACSASLYFSIHLVSWRNVLGSLLLRYREDMLLNIMRSALIHTLFWSLYAGTALSAVSFTCSGNWSGSASESAYLRGFLILPFFVQIIRIRIESTWMHLGRRWRLFHLRGFPNKSYNG